MKVLLAAVSSQKSEPDLNLSRHLEVLHTAARSGCCLAVFPEMSLSGYINPENTVHSPLTINSDQVSELVAATRDLGVACLFGMAEHQLGGKPFITQVLANAGQIETIYRKQNLGDNEIGHFVAGSDSVVGGVGNRRFGIAICADRDIDSPFILAGNNSAGLAFLCAAPGLYPPRRTDEQSWKAGFDWWRDTSIEILGRHARENSIYIGIATQSGTTVDEDFPGWAALIDPDGQVMTETPDWNEALLEVEIPRI